MKGPGLRIDLDVRRVWRCATCGRSARTAAHVVAQRCGCSELSPWMILQSPVKRAPFQPPVREPLPELDVTEDRPVTPHPVAEVPVAEVPVAEVPVAEVPVAELPPEIAPAADSSFSESPVEASRSALDQTTAATESPVASPSAAAAESAAAAPASPAPTPEDPRPDEFGAGLSDGSSAPQP